jgi:hypothetical protein
LPTVPLTQPTRQCHQPHSPPLSLHPSLSSLSSSPPLSLTSASSLLLCPFTDSPFTDYYLTTTRPHRFSLSLPLSYSRLKSTNQPAHPTLLPPRPSFLPVFDPAVHSSPLPITTPRLAPTMRSVITALWAVVPLLASVSAQTPLAYEAAGDFGISAQMVSTTYLPARAAMSFFRL